MASKWSVRKDQEEESRLAPTKESDWNLPGIGDKIVNT
jgi:hypothetical protein